MFHEAFRHDVSGYQQIILDVVNRIQSGYIDKLEDEKRALGNRCKAIDSAPEIAPPPQEVLMGARTALQYLEATASAKLDSLLQVGKGTPQSETSVGSESVVTGPAPAPPDRLTAIEAVLTQLTRMRSEEGFLQAFLTNTGLRDRRTAANEVPKVLLLGPHREQAIHLVSLLGHRLRDFRKLADEAKRLPETAWLSRSPVPSAPLVQARLVLPPIWEQALQACQDRGLDLTLAPADHLLSADVPWERLLPGFDSIVVFFDMERVSAGVVDRERAPYFAPMGKKEIAQRECLACPYGALFAKELPSLFTQVMKEMRENQLTTNVFLYEDYDTRYTNFLLLLPELLSTKMDGKNQLKRSVVDLWLANGMSTEWPFTIDSLSKINIDHVRAAFGENSVRGKGT